MGQIWQALNFELYAENWQLHRVQINIIIFNYKMTNSLIQELCKHINRLQTENERLQTTIDKHHTLFQEICKVSGSDTWTVFLGWLFEHFKIPSNKIASQDRAPCNSRSVSAERLSKELFSESDLPSIQEEIEQTSSRNSLATHEDISLHDMIQTAKWANETLNLSQFKKQQTLVAEDDQSLSAVDYIIIENSNLRRQNSKLIEELEKSKESLQSLVFVLKVNESDKLTDITNSAYNSKVSLR